MKVFNKISEVQAWTKKCRTEGKRIGFVPTMGALHEGHISLVGRSLKECDLTLVSIFVNPIQFNNTEDLEKYPRMMDQDLCKLKEIGCDVVFAPDVEEMYPEEVSKEYNFDGLDSLMEGKFRPGHFNGVAIVVNRLFSICMPHKAYFGEKDFQQLAIIKKMVALDNLDVEIVPCKTVREADGLAMSSRNLRLNAEDRAKAPLIYKVLSQCKHDLETMSPKEALTKARAFFDNHKDFELEYIELVDFHNLRTIEDAEKVDEMVVCIAARLGGVRLIDNVIIFL